MVIGFDRRQMYPQAKHRFVAAPPIFQIKIVDKEGVREVKKV